MNSILIIDDEENMLHMLSTMLDKAGFSADSCGSGEAGLEKLKTRKYHFVLCDVKMPGMSGLEFLAQVLPEQSDITIIMMSAYGSIDLAVEAMKAGAYDFISKPFKKDEVLLTLKKATERERLRGENRRLKKEVAVYRGDIELGEMIWKSPVMGDVVKLAEKAAHYESTVLITGESGTGKEVLAKGIHKMSKRSEKTFWAINCGSIPGGLLESELFGHVKGAFTGATEFKKGIFQEADKSTLLLDEIGELPMEMQVKLLRVLQENEVKPVGANMVSKIDVRIIAATAKDLEKEVQKGRFRKDLFYRLNVINLKIPALRDRHEDILPLTTYFIRKYSVQFKKNITNISDACLEQMCAHDWPGNVRELENAIQRALVLCENDKIESLFDCDEMFTEKTKKVIDSNCCGDGLDNLSIKQAQIKYETYLITEALRQTGGNKTHAAKLLEISYPSLLQKIKEYGVDV